MIKECRVRTPARREGFTDVWGTVRARLEPEKGTDLKGRENNFYLHDSQKGHTSGCTECEHGLFDKLLEYKKNNKEIEVLVKYDSNNQPTNGK